MNIGSPPQQPGAFANSLKSEVSCAYLAWVKPFARVLHAYAQPTAIGMEFDSDVVRPAVAARVAQSFLDNPKCGNLDQGWKPPIAQIADEIDLRSTAAVLLIDQQGNGRLQSGFIENRGTQPANQSPRFGNGIA